MKEVTALGISIGSIWRQLYRPCGVKLSLRIPRKNRNHKKRYGHTTEAVLPGKVQAGTAYAAEKAEWNVAHSARKNAMGSVDG